MCGIAGVSELNHNTRRLLPFLAYEMEARGRDSWGAMSPTKVHKSLGPITKSWDGVLDGFADGGPFNLHTRAGSVGSVKEENSHPFLVVGSKCTVLGMHNGCVSNWQDLAKEYNVQYEVDSHYICHAIANGLPTSEIIGWGAFVWLQWENEDEACEPSLNFVRFNMNDFHIAKLVDDDKTTTLAWCSTNDALKKACRMVGLKVALEYKLSDNTHYQYLKSAEQDATLEGGYPLVTLGSMQFGRRHNVRAHGYAPSASDYIVTRTSAGFKATKRFSVNDVGACLRVAGKCIICKAPGVKRHKDCLCKACIEELRVDMEESYNENANPNSQYMVYGLDWEYSEVGDFIHKQKQLTLEA